MPAELRNLPAPAKLNLFLHVTGRRPDGYHLLETVFQLIDLADTVHLQRLDDGRIERATELAGVAPEDDLTVRAARRLAQSSGSPLGVRIGLDKRIPMGGGLGGGSSDAATVLLGLNRLWDLRWPADRLAELALGLGADVPFFVRGNNAYATGVGEELRALDLAPRCFVLVAPAAAVPTVGIFTAPELTRNTIPLKIDSLSPDRAAQLPGRNDLQPVVLARYPKVAQALEALRQTAREVGIDPSAARMTGSGACLFLPVPDTAVAQGLANQLSLMQAAGSMRAWAVRSLAQHPLVDWAYQPV